MSQYMYVCPAFCLPANCLVISYEHFPLLLWSYHFFKQFLIHMSNIWMYVLSHSCLSSWLAEPSILAKTLTLDITCELLNVIFFTPAMHIGSIDFNHFVPLSLTLTFPGGHKVSGKQKHLVFIFMQSFQLIRMKFDIALKQFKLNILMLLLSEIIKQGKYLLFY